MCLGLFLTGLTLKSKNAVTCLFQQNFLRYNILLFLTAGIKVVDFNLA